MKLPANISAAKRVTIRNMSGSDVEDYQAWYDAMLLPAIVVLVLILIGLFVVLIGFVALISGSNR